MPAFAYTIGLHGIGHPELLVFGLGFEPAKLLLTRLAHEVRDHGVQLVEGQVIPNDRTLDRPLLVESLPTRARSWCRPTTTTDDRARARSTRCS